MYRSHYKKCVQKFTACKMSNTFDRVFLISMELLFARRWWRICFICNDLGFLVVRAAASRSHCNHTTQSKPLRK